MFQAFGAEMVLTPAEKGMPGAIEKVHELARHFKHVFIPSQFENPANPDIHRKTTAQEIWRDADGQADVFVAGLERAARLPGLAKS